MLNMQLLSLIFAYLFADAKINPYICITIIEQVTTI